MGPLFGSNVVGRTILDIATRARWRRESGGSGCCPIRARVIDWFGARLSGFDFRRPALGARFRVRECPTRCPNVVSYCVDCRRRLSRRSCLTAAECGRADRMDGGYGMVGGGSHSRNGASPTHRRDRPRVGPGRCRRPGHTAAGRPGDRTSRSRRTGDPGPDHPRSRRCAAGRSDRVRRRRGQQTGSQPGGEGPDRAACRGGDPRCGDDLPG